MSRITSSTAKFSRAMSVNATTAARPTITDIYSHSLMPKYAELLASDDHTRALHTPHSPRSHKLSRNRPLMQTFTHSASTTAPSTKHIDSTVVPTPTDFLGANSSSETIAPPNLRVVATDPSVVQPATPLVSVQSTSDAAEMAFDGSESRANGWKQDENTMFKDIWRGLVDDVVDGVKGSGKKAAA